MDPASAPWRVLETPSSEPAARSADPPARAHVPWPVVAAALLVLVVGVAAFLLASGSDPVIAVDGAGADPIASDAGIGLSSSPIASAPSAHATTIVVEVGGAVAHPGVYSLPGGARIGDAIRAAGGYGTRVDANAADRDLNLAAIVKDGDEVHVPSRDDTATPPPANPTQGSTRGDTSAGGAGEGRGAPIDLNSATAAQLDSLPGIGPVTAAKIIAAREEQRFATLDDLGRRKVLGPSVLEKIKALVTVGP